MITGGVWGATVSVKVCTAFGLMPFAAVRTIIYVPRGRPAGIIKAPFVLFHVILESPDDFDTVAAGTPVTLKLSMTLAVSPSVRVSAAGPEIPGAEPVTAHWA